MSDDPNQRDTIDLPSTEAVPTPGIDHEGTGTYRLLRKLGEGGMGEVWLAEQTEPIRRRVALKIIKRGMDTKQVVARFEAERQALAMMDHPAVAKVFDAGATPRGRPFFVMEYVKGVPITEHCDRHRLTTRDRLRLFCEVCEGVQHAHQKAIIHRDLKPTNVLVTEQDGKRLPKIIDFGVAKATAQKLTEKTVYTELGVLIGTPEYMSPEQAELTGEDVDTRTDVYSLGVMLYELLIGALPFDSEELRSGGYEGIRRKILEEEPRKPSTRLSTLGDGGAESAKHRNIDQSTLQRQLRGDLDWITMKALEKDRSRRYGSPTDLAADIGRYLADEPVLASPPSTVYRARKFIRRHQFGVLTAATAMVVLIGFAATMAVQAGRIAAERDRANREREAADQVSAFLADMLGDLDPHLLGRALWEDLRERVIEKRRSQGATEDEVEVTLANFEDALAGVNATDAALGLLDEQVLARAAKTIEQQLAEEPRIAGRLEHTLGTTYRRLGLYARAEFHAVRAVEVRRRTLGAEHTSTLQSMNNLAIVYGGQGRYDEAEKLHGQVLEIRRRVLGVEHPDALWSMDNLATAHKGQGRYDEAAALHREALEIRKRVLGPEHLDTLSSVLGLANVYWFQGRYEEAADLYLETLEIRRRVLGAEHPDTIWCMYNLAMAYWNQGRYGAAERLHRETLELRSRVLGMEHPDTLSSTLALAAAYWKRGSYEEAEKLYRQSLDARRRVLGADHPDTADSLYYLACVEVVRGDREKAMRWLRQAVAAGYAKPDSMIKDLGRLQGPEFETLVEAARRSAAAQRQD